MFPHKTTNFEPPPLPRPDGLPVDWKISNAPVEYPDAVAQMQERVARIIAGTSREQVWLLEHPPLYTSGTSARPEDLLTPGRFPVFRAGRGGQFTYHGPGQRVVYVMLDLRRRGRDIRRFVANLEAWLIETLAAFNIFAHRSPGRVGVWVDRPDKGVNHQEKIAAIGVRVSKWVSFHGVSLNIMPDLTHYQGIVPCGIADSGVTSLEDLGHLVSMAEVDMVLKKTFEARFGLTAKSQE